MGAKRKEPDDEVFNQRRSRYLENREEILSKAKERYQKDKQFISDCMKQARKLAKGARKGIVTE